MQKWQDKIPYQFDVPSSKQVQTSQKLNQRLTITEDTKLPLSANAQSAIQMKAISLESKSSLNSHGIHQAALTGVQGIGSQLPYLDKLQTAFGRYDISQIQSYSDSKAKAASNAIGAEAYTIGNRIAFADSKPSLHTVAHETTHVIQQQNRVSLPGGVGKSGDYYERQADAIADQVCMGRSAESAIDQIAKTSGANLFTSPILGISQNNIQMKLRVRGKNIKANKVEIEANSDDYKLAPEELQMLIQLANGHENHEFDNWPQAINSVRSLPSESGFPSYLGRTLLGLSIPAAAAMAAYLGVISNPVAAVTTLVGLVGYAGYSYLNSGRNDSEPQKKEVKEDSSVVKRKKSKKTKEPKSLTNRPSAFSSSPVSAKSLLSEENKKRLNNLKVQLKSLDKKGFNRGNVQEDIEIIKKMENSGNIDESELTRINQQIINNAYEHRSEREVRAEEIIAPLIINNAPAAAVVFDINNSATWEVQPIAYSNNNVRRLFENHVDNGRNEVYIGALQRADLTNNAVIGGASINVNYHAHINDQTGGIAFYYRREGNSNRVTPVIYAVASNRDRNVYRWRLGENIIVDRNTAPGRR